MKLQAFGINVKLLNLMHNYLCSQQKQVVQNGQTPSWKKVWADVPQSSALGHVELIFCLALMCTLKKNLAHLFILFYFLTHLCTLFYVLFF